MAEIELSIIIPTLNEEHYLPNLLQSLACQEYKSYEIIVADAGSRDKTIEIAKCYGCRVIKGGKPPYARNEGAKCAKGKYLFFFDADALLPPNFLCLFMRKVKQRGIEVASCAAIPQGTNKIDRVVMFIFNCYDFSTQLFYPHDVGGYCFFCSKSVHEAVQGYDESLCLGEDHDYALRAGKKGKFRFFWYPKVYCSVRRYDAVGRTLYLKHLWYEFARIILGDKRAQFVKYDFNYKKESEAEDEG